ncbi:AbrB/MazE/SpoVT family DNA-binding domain-containing protein [Pontiella sulfatireligans]|uniref:SpoVT-AbrB domain-containing protein n=1 Tax=Pontiella sulfatireligans TaxID=2750658 RepID=A0A6C2UM99_9BACT|nr:AbrB/MazE/SpoVT family DNA-binding domain-containing protein [Pontiella sulfatireligans]VGO21043.1 hypothetical protein SCARR_03112 [Pontiella sulfatireligans]
MKAKIIRIGNSQGIRIPKPIIEQCGIKDSVELEIHDRELVIRAPKENRSGWDGQYKQMAEAGDDQLFVAENQSKWDGEEWEW